MAVRYLVQDTFPRTTGGPRVLGVLQEGELHGGETLLVEATGAPVRVLSYDWHPRQTETGLQLGLRLHPEDAPMVAVGSTLVSPPTA
jgi:selenocysteine-specific translation elongation factor